MTMNALQTYEQALAQAQQFVWLLHGQNKAMVQLMKLGADKKTERYYSFQGDKLPNVVADWLDQDDVYIALNVFRGFERKAEKLIGYNALYTDLDFYKLGITKAAARKEIQRMINEGEILPPSLLIDSGRGYQLIWLVNFMKATDGYSRLWRAMQGAIYDRFKHLNADNAARSTTQIYRLVGSWSSRTNTQITFEHLSDRYEIGELKDWLLDEIEYTPAAPSTTARKPRKKRAYTEQGLTPHTLAKARKTDLEQLVDLRQGRVNRRRLIFYYAIVTLESYGGDVDKLTAALRTINSRFAAPLSQHVLDSAKASAYNSYTLKKGNKNMGYKFTNAYLMDNLEITADEQQYMTQLIGAAEKNERKRQANEKARRAAGVKSMTEYNQERQNAVQDNLTRLRAILAEQPDLSQRKIAAALGVSAMTISRLIKQL